MAYSQGYGTHISSRPGKTATTDYGPQYLSNSEINPLSGGVILSSVAPGAPKKRFLFIKTITVCSSVQAKIKIQTFDAASGAIEEIPWQVEAGLAFTFDMYCPLRIPSEGTFKVIASENITGTIYAYAHGWYESFINDVVNG